MEVQNILSTKYKENGFWIWELHCFASKALCPQSILDGRGWFANKKPGFQVEEKQRRTTLPGAAFVQVSIDQT